VPRASTADTSDADFALGVLRARSRNRKRCVHGVPPSQWSDAITA